MIRASCGLRSWIRCCGRVPGRPRASPREELGLKRCWKGAKRVTFSGTELRPSRALWGSLDLVFSDPRLRDRVADNLDKWDITESESLLFGRGFGITTDIQTGPNGHLFPP